MYQVFIAEDEPAALEHICTIIQNKCPNFQVVGTAEEGKSALEQLEYLRPDVLITDVKMPVMDGIFLIKRVKEKYPDILSVIISGYQEFDYAQSALYYGVCDYILKPVKPSTLQESMYMIQGRLDEYYYGLRNRTIREMYLGNISDPVRFRRIFSDDGYYIALLRKNSLPRRFAEFRGVEIFSIKEEQLMVYGRDEMEALYICPVKLMVHSSFEKFMMHILEKQKNTAAFHTLVLKERPVPAEKLPEMIRQLYQTMDYQLVIGKNQIIRDEDFDAAEKGGHKFDNSSLSRLEFLIKEHNRQDIPDEISRCFAKWSREEYTQLWTEEKVREMFSVFRRADLLDEPVAMCEYFIDEAFYYAENMQKLAEDIRQILCRNILEESRTWKIDTPEFFDKVEKYLKEHLTEPLSPQKICDVFGISQAYLSRLFRKYSTVSFSKRLTILRVEKAQQIMRDKRELYIKDIASRVGYGDQFYFSRIFRSVTGISPTEYMEELKND
ncbi:response regulator transcription factor [Robinsoniella sp. KNHs210]|uniref:response regulator transcription factor n=1 Tax=Robinsoniella sp. KNHs210 TaxID=1469950 RepID=UPI000483694C|nr:response regulator [Robinsoniella sp. KNHs210]